MHGTFQVLVFLGSVLFWCFWCFWFLQLAGLILGVSTAWVDTKDLQGFGSRTYKRFRRCVAFRAVAV